MSVLILVAGMIALVAPLGTASADSDSAREELDVVFVLDNSGSMRQNDPEFLTRRAVSDFIDALAADGNIDGRIALVLFDGRAQLAQSLTPANAIAATRRLDTTLAALDFSGQQTNSPAGIERALYELRERGRPDARKAIIFLSDGRIDTGDAQRDVEVARWLREDLASESAASSVLIFGIAFTDEADYQLMQALAQRTRAQYYRAFAATELPTVVDDVLSKLLAPPVSDLALIENATALPASTPEPEVPDVAAAPIAIDGGDAEDGWNRGLLAWIPILLLLVAAPLVARWRGIDLLASIRQKRPFKAPPAQLLDVGGQIGETGLPLSLSTERTRIGRDPNSDLIIDDDTISSEHAIIEVSDGRYWLRDLRSTNGTRVGETRLVNDERVPLKGGDHIRFAEIDLMFVVEGYIPGGATVYLSSSMTPPVEWSVLADADLPPSAAVPVDHSENSEDAPLATSASASESDTEIDTGVGIDVRDEVESVTPSAAEQPPRPVLALLPDPVEPVSAFEEVTEPSFDEPVAATGAEVDQDATAQAQESNLVDETPSRPANNTLAEEDAPEDPVATHALRACLEYHLSRVSEISPDFSAFIERAFPVELREALPVAAEELLASARTDGRIAQREYTLDRIRYVICGVPSPMDESRDLFVEAYGGFTRLLTEQLQAESFREDRCEILAILTFGTLPQPWVSLSIVPDEGQDPQIDLLSYEFLTESERREIEPVIDPEISQSGLA